MRRPCEWFVVYSFNTNNISMLDSGWLQGGSLASELFFWCSRCKTVCKEASRSNNKHEKRKRKGRGEGALVVVATLDIWSDHDATTEPNTVSISQLVSQHFICPSHKIACSKIRGDIQASWLSHHEYNDQIFSKCSLHVAASHQIRHVLAL